MCAAVPAGTNPYLAARHVHNERYLSLAKSVRNWQLIAGGLLLANVGLTGGLVYVTGKQQVIPYVVEVDEAGSAAAIKALQPRTALDPLVVRAHLRRFLTDLRTISTDEELVRRQMNAAYHQCLEPAQNFLTAYYTENRLADLVKRGRTFPVHLTVTPLSPQSWRARWKEQLVGPDGTVVEESDWEATIEIALVQPQSAAERERSPLGVWIAQLHWAQV
jgi:type IV secretory pathway TrbF-like protein